MNRSGKLPQPTGDQWDDCRRELRWAMGGAGLTVDKLALMRTVLTLPAVATAADGVDDRQRLVRAHTVIADAARSLGNTVHARILRTALAVDYDGSGKDLTSRREQFIRAHNDAAREAGRNDFIGESTRAMFDVENEMLCSLLAVLGATPPGGGRVPDAMPQATTNAPAVGSWGLVHQEITYRLTRRAGREAEAEYVVYGVDGPIDSCDLPYYCSREGGRSSKFVMLEGGGLVADRELGRRNFRVATVQFRPLRTGEPHRLRFDVCFPPTRESEPWLVAHVVRPTERLVIRVSFDVGELPQRIWRIDGLLPEAHGGDADGSHALELDDYGCVETEFVRPPLSLTYGIAWQW